VVDEAGVGAHRCVAAPTADIGDAVLSHVLLCCQRGSREAIAWQVTYNVVVALVVRVVATILAKKAVLKVHAELGLSSTMLTTLGAGKCEGAALVVLIELGQTRKYALAALALEVIALEMLRERGLVRSVEVATWL
jgi:hypothetical protein